MRSTGGGDEPITCASDPRPVGDGSVPVRTALALAVIGLALTWIFWSIAVRLGNYNRYWMASARELEKMMAPAVVMIQRGLELRNGVKVDGEKHGFTGAGRVSAWSQLHWFYGAFGAIFVFLIGYHLGQLI